MKGLWAGAVVLLSGLMGVMAGQRRSSLVYIVSYLLMSVLSLAAIGLLLIFAATGLARDSDAPHGYFVDQEVCLPKQFSSFCLPLILSLNLGSRSICLSFKRGEI